MKILPPLLLMLVLACKQTPHQPTNSVLSGKITPIELIKHDVQDTCEHAPIPEVLQKERIPTISKIAFVGDIMMDSFIANYIKSRGVDYPWEDAHHILQDATLTIGNLETSVSTQGASTKPERFGFRSHPDTLQGLVNAGFDIVSTANNHVLDFGPDAHLDTLKYLDAYNIQHMGSGENIEKAEAPIQIEHEGKKLCFIAYSDIIPKENWEATERGQGVASLKEPHLERIYSHIRRLKAEALCDQLFMNIHWGYEYKDHPSEKQVNLAHSFIDHGVDAIIGHHPHVLQGMELYKGKPILYSLGNFVFLVGDKEAMNTGIFVLNFEDGVFVGGKLVPFRIYACKANKLDINSSRARHIFHRMDQLSKNRGIRIDKEGYISLQGKNQLAEL